MNRSRASAPLACLLIAAAAACVSEIDDGDVVVLPANVDRFVQEPTRFVADEVVIECARQFRAEMAPSVNQDFHTKTITPDRIRLQNLEPGFSNQPVVLTFRNMEVKARQQIDVRFSDKSLIRDGEDAVVVLVIGHGVASLEGPGYEVTAPKVVIRNDRVAAFGANGESWPVPPALQ